MFQIGIIFAQKCTYCIFGFVITPSGELKCRLFIADLLQTKLMQEDARLRVAGGTILNLIFYNTLPLFTPTKYYREYPLNLKDTKFPQFSLTKAENSSL